MCIAVPCQIIEFIDQDKKLAVGDFIGIKRQINVQLLENIEIGDYCIVHVGYAIQKLDLEDALESIETFKEYLEFEKDLESIPEFLQQDEAQ